jgi:hypothetical protein
MMNWLEFNRAEDVSVARSFRVVLRSPVGELVPEIVTIPSDVVRANAARGPLSNRLRSHALSAALSAHPGAELVGSIERVLN